MAQRAALVTGGSGGIGFAIAEVLISDGYAVTISARRPEKLAAAAAQLRDGSGTVLDVPADLSSEDEIVRLLDRHQAEYGRLDVLVNNAGVGIGGYIQGMPTKHMDLQFAINLRSTMIFYREAYELLRQAGREERGALVINVSSITGKRGHEWLSVYSAIKHGVVGFTQAMNSELHSLGIKSCVLCPGYVDTDLTEYKRHELPREDMITTEDVASAIRPLLHLSKNCIIPEMMFTRPGEIV